MHPSQVIKQLPRSLQANEADEQDCFGAWSISDQPRSLTVLFRRDPSRDRDNGRVVQHGYEICWPEGQAVVVGLDALCRYGLRWLGVNRQLAGADEMLMELTCFDLAGRDDDLTRLPGHRIRRVSLRREGWVGRIHFIDGTPTEVVFVLGRDEQTVLDWIGLSTLAEGEHRWMDVSSRPVGTVLQQPFLAQATR